MILYAATPWSSLFPQMALTAGLVCVLGAGMAPRAPRAGLRLLGTASLLAALAAAVFGLYAPAPGFRLPFEEVSPSLIKVDLFSAAITLLACLGALPVVLLYSEDDEVPLALLLGCVLGMSLLGASHSLIMLFIGLELMSLPAYLLVARGSKPAALEAGVKYFFAGSVAGALFLLGMALYYAAARSLTLGPAAGPWAEAGLVLMGCAALFKLGAVPLHFWLPDVYEAAEPEVAGFFSTSMKAAAVLFLMRLAALAPSSVLVQALPWVGGVTALAGAFLALRQEDLQRLLAYSSISHAGYLILGVGAWAAAGRSAPDAGPVLFYLLVYLFVSTGAFLWLKSSGLHTRSALKGSAAARPLSCAAFAALLLTLAGLPPTGGFLAKLLVFMAALQGGLYWPVALAGLATLISAAYYLTLVREMYFEEPSAVPAQTGPGSALVYLCSVLAVLLGFAPLFLGAPR